MNNLMVVNGIDFRELVFLSGSNAETDTFKVALAFKKSHKDVLRKARSVIKSCSPSFAERNFTLCHENNNLQNGKPQPFYKMTRDGWMMLVMGFTGDEAVKLKEAFINAFNWMADVITKNIRTMEQERNEVILEFMKEKDVASMSGRLLNRWGRVKKPQLLNRIAEIEEKGQLRLPEFNA
ncbi:MULTISPECIES: Rha family transcriptional regulator [Providencia]|uniref:Rha family transcriptional regulator n=1 Tax=Providencia TaxID=586 RepID=UPI001B38D414|nr:MULTISPECIES: Rha family transcriptional regulator [Providencia]MBQ0207826.1 Rha family transcriptional regulator [Providencia rettgeri]MCK9788023.1 Rha family transcriptional regulator [Providencia rettgeri]MDR9614020.1 Rha family transcriptional regulator [Providencia rettgeri]MDX7424281.1 Rha family transcriptional regulator [Providencia sp. CIM-Carb-044]WOC04929.1 Rha family transcriptional regulator [Providencia sp. PROV024]